MRQTSTWTSSSSSTTRIRLAGSLILTPCGTRPLPSRSARCGHLVTPPVPRKAPQPSVIDSSLRRQARRGVATDRVGMLAAGSREVTLENVASVQEAVGLALWGGRIEIETGERIQVLDLTNRVADLVARSGIRSGLAHLGSLHTTLGLFVNEPQPALLD